MPRRRGAGFSADHLAEMGAGRVLSGVMRPRVCVDAAWCPACREGFDCRSNFASDADREAFYWARRAEVLSGVPPAARPWSFWRYEAPGVCRHEPRCVLPDAGDWPAQRAWLDRHEQLSGAERTALARSGDTDGLEVGT